MQKLASIAAFLAWMGAPVYGQSAPEICGAVLLPEQFVGTYDLIIGNMLLFGDGKILPLTSSQTKGSTISVIGGDIVLESDGYSITLNLADDDYTADWNWDAMTGTVELTSDEFSLLFDCPVAQFPRLTGQASIQTDSGLFVSNYYLVAHSVTDAGVEMLGAVHGEGGGISMKRAVRIVPN